MKIEKNRFDSLHYLIIFVASALCATVLVMLWERNTIDQETEELLLKNVSLVIENKALKENEIVEKIEKEDVKQNLSNSLSYLNPNVDPLIKEQIVDALITESKKQNLPPLLPLCIIRFESNFNPLIKNKLGATGLMQIIPKYHQDKIDEHGWKAHEVFFIKNNILLGCQILKEYFEAADNDIGKALQKYVGAIEKKNAGTYIEDIISNYLSLDIIYFMDNIKKMEENTDEIDTPNETR